ncbi:hypothetical protein L484_004230 [Morus notabilis]|uniref:Uncharacterized protein n=1 Tax=Morus notabilis TaxID=981085 RepID=W9RUR0_9ROSA|nr:hypothetical protein L484_004230 [Morus notabilis]
MEDEKNKKKRNKKKKNKQNKTADEVAAVGGGEATSEDQNHASNGKDDHGQIAESADVGNGGKDLDVGLTRNGPNGTDSMVLAESEKQQWLQRETTLEDTIDKLRKENNLHLQKEATFEMKIVELQSEIESWIRKEGHLEARISHLVDEKTTWSLKEVSLQEKLEHLENEKRAWTLNEDLIRETIANLNDDVLRLRVQLIRFCTGNFCFIFSDVELKNKAWQVVELEESRNNVLQENQQLLENVSSLQLQIKDLHSIASTQSSDEFTKLSSERDELSSQVEAACTLVERLIAENAELVEKVNELFIELDRRGGSLLPSTAAYKLMVGTAETASFSDRGSETITDVPKSGQELNSIEVVEVKEEMNGIHKSDNHRTDVVAEPKIFEEAGEIVQIPLDENEVPDLELQVNLNGERDSVPISDAPLIGAPFRLISFVSRYVSGADLVNKNSLQV